MIETQDVNSRQHIPQQTLTLHHYFSESMISGYSYIKLLVESGNYLQHHLIWPVLMRRSDIGQCGIFLITTADPIINPYTSVIHDSGIGINSGMRPLKSDSAFQ